MRVTDRLVFDTARSDIAAASERAQQAQHVASTGVKLEHAWDDPAAASQLTTETMAQARYQAIGKAAGAASDELQSVDAAFGSVANALTRARELAVQFANSTYDASQRAAGATEVDGLIGQIVSALNVEVAGRYVLGGTSDRSPPFDASGNYLGSPQQRMVEVAPGVLQASSIRADVAIKGAGGGVDVIATLQSLKTALNSNNVTAVSATLDAISTSVDQVSQARSETGVAMAAFDAAATASDTAVTGSKTRTSQLQDADIADAATQLTLTQQGLQASYAAAAKSFQLSILNYLG